MPILTATCLLSLLVSADDRGLRVAPGFRVTVYSGPELSNDVYAMTLDPQGRVVVTSRGWIKVLHPSADGTRAEMATTIATTQRGGMGLCFDGNDLLFTGDGWLSRYRWRDGKLDDMPEKIAPFQPGEHGGHNMRQGPDGWWYVLGGNDAGISAAKHNTRPNPLVPKPEAGALVRYSPDFKRSEVIAHGWRNPYRFDFNALGDLFLYDSDTERDNFLPWYTPTRVYHVAPGAHHGWRLEGYMRSWCRPGYYLDSVEPLALLGRGSPTGVVCYRHDQFPERYRGGLFVLDWTFGKVFFLPLKPDDGAIYETRPEIFVEAVGTSGFNPTDAVVAPDGALLISMGGRGTRGAVYRVEYVGDGKVPQRRRPAPKDDLEAVLYAPQPLDAWSRARWMPLARKLGAKPFRAVLEDEKRDEAARIRALEVLTELFGGVTHLEASKLAHSPSPLVRARVAWSLGRVTCSNPEQALVGLANDSDSRVRACALVSMTERLADVDAEDARLAVLVNYGSTNERVMQAAARLGARLPEESWKRLRRDVNNTSGSFLIGGGLILLEREGDAAADTVVSLALKALATVRRSDIPLQSVRLIMLALGDWDLRQPTAEVFTGYTLRQPLQGREALAARVRTAVRPLFPAKDEYLDLEVTRLLAMLEDDDPQLIRRVAAQWTADSPAPRDLHYLIVLARLRGPWPDTLPAQVAKVILGLNGKLHGQEMRDKQNWNMRLTELVTDIIQRHPRVASELVRQPELYHGAHVYLTDALPTEQRRQAAEKFWVAARLDGATFEWTGKLVELLRELPAEQVRPILRKQWDNFGLRDSILARLADPPEEEDRQRFLDGLESSQPAVVRASLQALMKLPRDPAPERLIPVLTTLRGLQQEPKQANLRQQALALLNRQAEQQFRIEEKGTSPEQLRKSYQPVFDWFRTQHPKLAAKLDNADGEDPASWNDLLRRVDWPRGNAARGEKLFVQRACATCHAGTSRIGPDLTGVATRFSRDDLFQSIIFPSRDVAPAYRTVTYATKAGQVYSGLVVFFSADGVILQTDASTTIRIANDDIETRAPSTRSLMPSGLLKDLKPDDLADLYAYLQTLKPAGAPSAPR